jgi:hypothetical protein
MVAGTCPRCAGVVALHQGRPFVTTDGIVELWHRACFDDRDLLVLRSTPLDFLPTPPTPRLIRVLGSAVAGSMLVAIVIGQWTWGEMAPPLPASLANIELIAPEPVQQREVEIEHEVAPPPLITVENELEVRFSVPARRGVRLDELFPTLRAWTHPVTAAPELIPEQASRRFGAHRDGIERRECGEGHCGVDLDGPRGRPIVAVAGGTVVRVELSELGLDGRSGRYVRIEHDDGTLTSYMHMDDVAAVRVGDRVAAGQYLGTLGATAVFSAPPHLHFALEVPDRPGEHGDITDTHFVDPAPFLVRSMIADPPPAVAARRERTHAIRPVF